MKLAGFSTCPPLKECWLDRRGLAPRTAGCKPADFLANLAAQKKQRPKENGTAGRCCPDPAGFWRPGRTLVPAVDTASRIRTGIS